MRPPRRVIIDSDPGIDDVVAITLAARSPEINLIAVTTTYGTAPLALTTRNAHLALRLAGRPDIPVLPGADRPRSRIFATAPATETHGESGVGYAPVPPAVPRQPAPQRDVLVELLRRVPPPVTLLTLGPLTNLANALESDRALVTRHVQCHIGMFGALHERGAADRWADFNCWCDPDATERVINSELPTHMVGLDATRQMIVTADEVARLAEAPDALTRWLAAALLFYVESHRRMRGLDGCFVHDVLPTAEILGPGTLRFQSRNVLVDLDESERRGHTTEGGTSTIQTAISVDTHRIRRLLTRVFGQGWRELGDRMGLDE